VAGQKDRIITPRDVVFVARAQRPSGNSASAQRGIEEHRKVVNQLQSSPGSVFPGFERRSPLDLRGRTIEPEKTVQAPVNSRSPLVVRARADAFVPAQNGRRSLIVEIKPGPATPNDLLQTSLTQKTFAKARREPVEALLITYRDGQVHHLPHSTQNSQDHRRLLLQATVIRNGQRTLDEDARTKKRKKGKSRQAELFELKSLSPEETRNIAQRSIRVRRGFDRTIKKVLSSLTAQAKRVR
jgi:hypothetical protein